MGQNALTVPRWGERAFLSQNEALWARERMSPNLGTRMSISKAVRIGSTLLAGCALVPAVAWLLDIAVGRMLVIVAVFVLLPAVGGVLPRLTVASWLVAVGGLVPMLLSGPVLWWMGVLGEIGFLRFAGGWGLFVLGASILQAGITVGGRDALRMAANRDSR